MEQLPAKVLVVDDNPEIRDIIHVLLEGEGIRVTEAADGASALHFLEKDSFDLIILDIMMPGLNGYETCQKIRQLTNVPILFLSARTSDSDKLMGFSSGGVGSSGNAGPLWICRLVYRNAELTLPDVYRHHAEYCQYYRQFVFRLSLGYESGRSRRRNPYRTVCRFLYGHTIVYALLQYAPKTYCMERHHTEAGNVPFLPGKS